jgi:hypothetical protein
VTIDEAKRLLATAPGPCPWYLPLGSPFVDSRWGPLTWRKIGNAPALVDPSGAARFLLGMYGFAIKLASTRMLVWYQHADAVHFHVVNVDALEPIESVKQCNALMELHRLPWIAFDLTPTREAHDVVSVPIRSDGGTRAVGFPSEMDGIEELAFFVAGNRPGSGTQLWVARPSHGLLDVHPQDWFNDGSFDFGYQWPTRATRDAQSGRFVCEGIRLDHFVLDDMCRNVAEWLR